MSRNTNTFMFWCIWTNFRWIKIKSQQAVTGWTHNMEAVQWSPHASDLMNLKGEKGLEEPWVRKPRGQVITSLWVSYLDSSSLATSRDMWLESDAVLKISTALSGNTVVTSAAGAQLNMQNIDQTCRSKLNKWLEIIDAGRAWMVWRVSLLCSQS